MHQETHVFCYGTDPDYLFEWIDSAAASVVGVLKRDQPGWREVMIIWTDSVSYLLGGKDPALSLERVNQNSRKGGHASGFIVKGVTVPIGDDFIPVVGLRSDG
jgi:hypothetical protein